MNSQCGTDTECESFICMNGQCMRSTVSSGTTLATQTPNDCKERQCGDDGAIVEVADENDLPVVTEQCLDPACDGTTPDTTPSMEDSMCSDGVATVCDGAGQCVECNRGEQCSSGVCTGNACQPPACDDGVNNGDETGVDCGGTMCGQCPQLLLLAGGQNGGLGGVFDGTAWSTSTVAGVTSYQPVGLVALGAQKALGVAQHAGTSSSDPDNQEIRYTIWDGTSWSTFADVADGVPFPEGPALARGAGGTAHLAATEDIGSFQVKYAHYDGTAWSAFTDVNDGAAVQSSQEPVMALVGGNVMLGTFALAVPPSLEVRELSGGTWSQPTTVLSSPNQNYIPGLLPIPSGPSDAMVLGAWSTNEMYFSVRDATTKAWSTAAKVPGTTTMVGRPGMTVLADGRVLVAYMVQLGSNDFDLYVTIYDGTDWSNPQPVYTQNFKQGPVVTRGVGTATAELLFINNFPGQVMHARLINGSWTTPVLVSTVSSLQTVSATLTD